MILISCIPHTEPVYTRHRYWKINPDDILGRFEKQSFLLQVLVKDTLQTEAKQH